MSNEWRVGPDPFLADDPQQEDVLLPGVWPAPINVEGILESPSLSPEQDARCSALFHARSVLETRGGMAMPDHSSRPPKVDDLLATAQWIITGVRDG